MIAEFMNDRGYVTYYLKLDLTTRQTWVRSVYEEDIQYSSMPDWDEDEIMSLANVKSLLSDGFITNDRGYTEGRYDLIHLSED